MTKLSDTQLVILTAACQRDDRLVLPLPDRLKGGAAAKVVGSLIAKGLIQEVDAKRGETVWRDTGDGHDVTLVVTDAAFAALGIEIPQEEIVSTDAPVAPPKKARRKTRDNSKQAQLIALLRRPDGATIAELADALGWQHHTVRGAIAGALKNRLGLDVTSEKVEERGRIYRIAQ